LNILFLLSPLFLWGLNPLIIRKIDGHDSNEMFGTGVGALVMGIAVLFFIGNWSQASALKLFLSFLSGAAWSIGQLGQYVSYRKIGVSKTMPISTGLQILGASVIGVLVYGEWAGTAAKIEGAIAITILIAGVYLISVADKNSSSSSLKEYLPLIFTSIGYWVYSC
jgi:glucose uptake protein